MLPGVKSESGGWLARKASQTAGALLIMGPPSCISLCGGVFTADRTATTFSERMHAPAQRIVDNLRTRLMPLKTWPSESLAVPLSIIYEIG